MKQIIIVFSFFLFSNFTFVKINNAQTDAETRALWTFNMAYGTKWQNESKIDTFEIAVFSSQEEFLAFENLAKDRTIHDKPVKILKYSDHDGIREHHIVYVTKNENAYLAFVYQKFKGKNVLIISDRSRQPEYSVINFHSVSESKKFDINTINADEQNLKFSKQLIKLGGSREDLQHLFQVTRQELRIANDKIKLLESECDKKDKQIRELEDEITKLKNSKQKE